MNFPRPAVQNSTRAKPLSVEERRAMIVTAVIPLLAAHGRELTSRQIAEAAGIAEGTIFRAFGDKDSLIDAAIRKILDPEPLRRQLRAIDPHRPLEEKMVEIISLLRRRFAEVFRIMTVVGADHRAISSERAAFAAIIAETLAPELPRLSLSADRIAQLIRFVAFSSSFHRMNDGLEFTPQELAEFVLYGIAGHPDPVHHSGPGVHHSGPGVHHSGPDSSATQSKTVHPASHEESRN